MSKFDYAAAVRWARFDPGRTLARRADEELPFLGNKVTAGQELLLDTCVYIDGLQGRAPTCVADLLDVRLSNHSSIAIRELMHTVGVLDPSHPSTATAIEQTRRVIEAMQSHRTFVPDIDVLGRAAVLCGMLCRLHGYQRDARLEALHDCALFLQAQKLSLTVLTANVSDFDYLLQLIPAGRVLFYRTV